MQKCHPVFLPWMKLVRAAELAVDIHLSTCDAVLCVHTFRLSFGRDVYCQFKMGTWDYSLTLNFASLSPASNVLVSSFSDSGSGV
jgi:hypothetical protein